MADEATFLQDLQALLPAIPPDSIVSRSVFAGDGLKVTLFGFAAGQELTEHTASRPAVLQFLRGRAHVVLGGKPGTASAGTWAFLPAHMPHSVVAEEELVMLLLLLGD